MYYKVLALAFGMFILPLQTFILKIRQMCIRDRPVIAQYDEGGKGTCQPKEVSAKHGLADGPAFADRSNEERGCHAPYHPVGPIENRP